MLKSQSRVVTWPEVCCWRKLRWLVKGISSLGCFLSGALHSNQEQSLFTLACRAAWGESWQSKHLCHPPHNPLAQAVHFLFFLLRDIEDVKILYYYFSFLFFFLPRYWETDCRFHKLLPHRETETKPDKAPGRKQRSRSRGRRDSPPGGKRRRKSWGGRRGEQEHLRPSEANRKPLTDLGGTSQSLPHKHSVFSISKHLLHLHILHQFSSFNAFCRSVQRAVPLWF